MNAVKAFNDAAAAAVVELVERLDPAEQQRIVVAMQRGCRLSLAFVASTGAQDPEIRMDLVDAAGALHRLWTLSSQRPTCQ